MQKKEDEVCYKTLMIFETMRSNMAMLESFWRKSYLDPTRPEIAKAELGFLGNQSKEENIKISNHLVENILIAFLYQALRNYFEMVKMNPKLKDQNLETALDHLGNRDKFIRGMRAMRNCVFHVRSANSREKKSLEYCNNIFNQNGGVQQILAQIRKAAYDFTEKCFLGKLHIFPDYIYEMSDTELSESLEKIGLSKSKIDELLPIRAK